MAVPSQLPETAINRRGWGPSRIAALAAAAIAGHLILRYGFAGWEPFVRPVVANIPLIAALAFGGGLLVIEVLRTVAYGQFGADLLAGLSIVTSILLGEFLAGTLVVLMLSSGQA